MLTNREIEILELKKKGFSQKKISEKLNISPASVSDFVSNVKRKLADSMNNLETVKKMKIQYDKERNELKFD